jgi:hypothetical protein
MKGTPPGGKQLPPAGEEALMEKKSPLSLTPPENTGWPSPERGLGSTHAQKVRAPLNTVEPVACSEDS